VAELLYQQSGGRKLKVGIHGDVLISTGVCSHGTCILVSN